MLQNMREKMQGIIAGAVVTLITIPFVLWGIQNYLHGNAASDVVAKVDGVKITENDLRRAYSRAQQQEITHQGSDYVMDQKSQAILKDKVLQQIIRDEVLTKETEKLGLYIGPRELNASLVTLPIFQVNGAFSPDRFRQVLNGFDYTERDFTAELKRSILLGQLEIGIRNSSFTLPNEIDTAIKLIQQTRDLGYFTIDHQRFAQNIVVDQSEMQQYYDKHKDEFISLEQVSIEYIELNADAFKGKIQTDDAKLQNFYKDNPGLFAKEKNVTAQSFPKIKDKVRAVYERQQTQQLLADQHDKLTDLTYTNSDSLMPAATALALPIKTTELFTKQGARTGIAANPKIIKAAFSEAVLKQSYNSSPIEIAPGDIVVLRIKQHLRESTLPLVEVSNVVEQKLKTEKMHAAAKKVAEELMMALKNKQNPRELSKKYALTWQMQAKVGRKDSKVDTKILQAAFALPKPKDDLSLIALVDLQHKGYAVVQSVKVYDGDAKRVDAKQRQVIKDNLQGAWGAFEYSLLTEQVLRNAKVKIEKTDVDVVE